MTLRGLRRLVADLDGPYRLEFQGHVLDVGDFVGTWVVEVVVHHLDMTVALPGRTGPARVGARGGAGDGDPAGRSRRRRGVGGRHRPRTRRHRAGAGDDARPGLAGDADGPSSSWARENGTRPCPHVLATAAPSAPTTPSCRAGGLLRSPRHHKR